MFHKTLLLQNNRSQAIYFSLEEQIIPCSMESVEKLIQY